MDFELDKYDLFNAPQYVDFNELVRNERSIDDDADRFFETHREEDDFFPSCISPSQANGSTIPLQYEHDEVYDIEAYYKAEKPAEDVVITPCESIEDPSESEPEVAAVAQGNSAHVQPPLEEVKDITAEPCETEMPRVTTNEVPEDAVVKVETSVVTATKEEEALEYVTKDDRVAEIQHLVEGHSGADEDLAPTRDTSQVQLLIHEVGEKFSALYTYEAKETMDQVYTVETVTIEKTEFKTEIKDEEMTVSDTVHTEVKPSPRISANTHGPTFPTETKIAKTILIKEPMINRAAIKKPTIRVTVPQPFKFSELRPKKTQELEKDTYRFRAKPIPVKALQGDVSHPAKQPPKTTQPLEIHFASDDRIKQRHMNMTRKSVPTAPNQRPASASSRTGRSSVKIALKSMPSSEKLSHESVTSDPYQRRQFRSRSSSFDSSKPPTPTRVKPFSFEGRDKELQRRKQEKIMKAIEAESKVKEFHAQPLPNFTSSLKRLPKKKIPEPTHPEPFKLKSDERGAEYQQHLQKKHEEEARRLREQAVFHAQPNEVIYKRPFEPVKPAIPIPEPIDPALNTDKRAEERARFDDMIRQKEAELEELRKKEKIMKELQEEKQAQAMRQMCVHKAKPAPKHRFFEVKNSEKALTDPKSPAFEPLPSQRRHKQSNKENMEA